MLEGATMGASLLLSMAIQSASLDPQNLNVDPGLTFFGLTPLNQNKFLVQNSYFWIEIMMHCLGMISNRFEDTLTLLLMPPWHFTFPFVQDFGSWKDNVRFSWNMWMIMGLRGWILMLLMNLWPFLRSHCQSVHKAEISQSDIGRMKILI